MDLAARRYTVVITHHARERWVERIADPNRYAHLAACSQGCSECVTLANDIRMAILAAKRGIDGSIAARFREATERVTDQEFIRAVAKRYGSDAARLDFRKNGRVIFVLVKEDPPVLITVMTEEMVQGMVDMTR